MEWGKYLPIIGVNIQNIKELMQFGNNNNKKGTNDLNLKCGEEPNIPFSKEDRQIANWHMKKCSTSIIIREMQTKTMMRCYLALLKMAVIKKPRDNNCWPECKEKGTLVHYWWGCDLVQLLWKVAWRVL